MAETSSPCMVRSFTQPSFSRSCDEGDILRALTSSISFGKYMTESLAWDKWSTFPQNNYREEALRYSRPGSVAEKKAFFEARFKTMASKKTAASSTVEQKSAIAEHSSGLNRVNQNQSNAYLDSSPGHSNGNNAVFDKSDQENTMAVPSTGQPICSKEVTTATMGDTRVSDKLPHASTTIKSSTRCPTSIPPKKTDHSMSSSSKKATTTKGSAAKKQFTPRSLHVSIDNIEFDDEPLKKSSPIFQKIVNSKFVKAMTNGKLQESRTKKSPLKVKDQKIAAAKQTEEPIFSEDVAKPLNASYLDENMEPEEGTVAMGDSDETTCSSATMKVIQPSTKCGLPNAPLVKPTPSIQSTKRDHSITGVDHVAENSEHDEYIKTSSPVLQKIVNSKFVRAITNNTTRENRSKISPIRTTSFSLSKPVSEPKITSNLKPSNANGSKTSTSSTTCASFVFRSEERAMKRKEFYQKLEQKLKEEQQTQIKAMGKRTNESTVLRASTSRVKPNFNNHLTRGDYSSISTIGKIPEMQKPASKVQENSSKPPWRLSGKSDSSKDVMGKNTKLLSRTTRSVAMEECRRENASPNIQV
ncbi:hypothetical protein DM860_009733 [Cuscuta australis]|uniref:TPX2 C-terminal domain-containing protein n=1 Tax=Cuscuta australis TaxID=267555 RepID=A0A328DFE5_9ASTE|nr:hypothetical protein DM860_009733 [Cuscuta australis]